MILDKIVEDKKRRLPQYKAKISEREMKKMAEEARQIQKPGKPDAVQDDSPVSPVCGACSFYEQMKKPGISIIGEFKQASPSLGQIKSPVLLPQRIACYNDSVDAISCLTEEDHFHGNNDFFRQIRQNSPLPMLRKDFMIDEYQFYEARVMGADAVLLIAAILDDGQLRAFYQLAGELGLDVLIEVHDEREVERTLALDPEIIGINNRNLMDFSITLETTKRLRKMVPKGKVIISESGILTDRDVDELAEEEVDGFLIGRALMEADDPGELAGRWKSCRQR